MRDLIGEKFGILMVIARVANNQHKKPMWSCECDCGNMVAVEGQSLKSNITKSCGCLQKEIARKTMTKHGHSKRGEWSQIYHAWASIIQRCTNPNNEYYLDYGGRGITVCRRWRKFENFLRDVGQPPTKNHSIDRIDNDGNYCPFNCRWATKKEQARNTRKNRLVTYDGKTQCIAVWAEEFSIDRMTLWQRLYRYNWPIKKALTTPVKQRRKNAR